MNTIRHIPNLITFARFICSFVLLFTEPLSCSFCTVYIICGASDVLDGYIARKIKANSQLGAIFDSISDLVFFGIILGILLPLFQWAWWMLFWIGAIAFVRIVSFITGFVKYNKIAFLHTYANKVTGFVLFFSPFLFHKFGMAVMVCLVCSLASVSAIEELAINLVSKRLDRDIRSIIVK